MTYMTLGIDTYSIEGLEALLTEWKQPRFRAAQLFEWLYGRGVASYDEMTNLPAALREKLAREAPLHFPAIEDKRVSADGTRKYLFRLADDNLVEAVGIPTFDAADETPSRLSVCFSTQVGCAMACSFCATGTEGFTRNLSPGEMAWQVRAVADDFNTRASSAVAMGQGEPFLNYDNVLAALRILNHPQGLGIGARHITVSTCGITDGIVRLGSEPEQFVLAVSLHSAVQETRDALMPRCAVTPLPQLKEALLAYQEASGRRISFEYLLIDGVNDGKDDFAALVDFCRGLSAHVNVLPYNPVEGAPGRAASAAQQAKWVSRLQAAGIEASVRTARGSDISGACGQLKNSR